MPGSGSLISQFPCPMLCGGPICAVQCGGEEATSKRRKELHDVRASLVTVTVL